MASLVVEKTKGLLFEHVPILQEQYWEKFAAGGKGKWMDRLQASAGPHKSGKDPHIAGRALDIILFASDGRERFVADQLVEVFLGLRESMHWSAVIYNGSEWNYAGQKLPRTGDAINRHVTHIHIEWRASDVNHTGYESDLADALDGVMDFGY